MKAREFMLHYFEKEDDKYFPKYDDTLHTIFTFYNPRLVKMWESPEFVNVRRLHAKLQVSWADLVEQNINFENKSYYLEEKQLRIIINAIKRYKHAQCRQISLE